MKTFITIKANRQNTSTAEFKLSEDTISKLKEIKATKSEADPKTWEANFWSKKRAEQALAQLSNENRVVIFYRNNQIKKRKPEGCSSPKWLFSYIHQFLSPEKQNAPLEAALQGYIESSEVVFPKRKKPIQIWS